MDEVKDEEIKEVEEKDNDVFRPTKGCLLTILVAVITAALVFGSIHYIFSRRDTQGVYEQMNGMFK